MPDGQEDHNWQSPLYGICYDCAKLKNPQLEKSLKAYRKAVAKKWLDRKYLQNDNFENRGRSITWKQAVIDVGNKYPSESYKDWRRRVGLATARTAALFAQHFALSTPKNRAPITEAFEKWAEDNEKAAADRSLN